MTGLVLGLRAGWRGLMDFDEEPVMGFGEGSMVGFDDVGGCEVVGFRLRRCGGYLCLWMNAGSNT